VERDDAALGRGLGTEKHRVIGTTSQHVFTEYIVTMNHHFMCVMIAHETFTSVCSPLYTAIVSIYSSNDRQELFKIQDVVCKLSILLDASFPARSGHPLI
jgi:hypothetical protein